MPAVATAVLSGGAVLSSLLLQVVQRPVEYVDHAVDAAVVYDERWRQEKDVSGMERDGEKAEVSAAVAEPVACLEGRSEPSGVAVGGHHLETTDHPDSAAVGVCRGAC